MEKINFKKRKNQCIKNKVVFQFNKALVNFELNRNKYKE